MKFLERGNALKRTQRLLEQDPRRAIRNTHKNKKTSGINIPEKGVSLLLYQAKLPLSKNIFLLIALLSGILLATALSPLVSPALLPFFALGGFLLPFSYLEGRVNKQTEEFSIDYPTILLATASSMRTGMTAHQALERSVRLLPEESPVRKEVETLLQNLRKGVSKNSALAHFGARIRQPDLELFRKAFLLVLEHGGRFAPTLSRLAAVSKDRATLIGSARVSTANMRMTANILLGFTPVILFVISQRTNNFLELLTTHETANTIASIGVVLILGSYSVLRRLSNFRP